MLQLGPNHSARDDAAAAAASVYIIHSVAMFCYGFSLKVEGPAWAVGSYSSGPPAGELNSQL